MSDTNLFGQAPWERRGEAATVAIAAVSAALPVGMITAYWGTTAPTDWLLCDGAAIPAQYAALIALVGANTPNLKGRVIVGIDAAQAEFDTLAETGGANTVTLTSAEMPAHTHTQDAHTHTQNAHTHPTPASSTAAINIGGTGGLQGAQATAPYTEQPQTATNQNTTATNQNTGGGGAHSNLQPYCALSYIIRAT